MNQTRNNGYRYPNHRGYEKEEHAAEAYDVAAIKCKGGKAGRKVRETGNIESSCFDLLTFPWFPSAGQTELSSS
jgi:hypothetical protein